MLAFCGVNSVGHVCALVASFVVVLICGGCAFGFVFPVTLGLVFAMIYLSLLFML